MNEIHPDLERAAQYVCSELGEPEETWTDFVPTARAAIRPLKVGQHLALGIVHRLNIPARSTIGMDVIDAVTEMLDDILREPKPTVADVLAEHMRCTTARSGVNWLCNCGGEFGTVRAHDVHQAEMLREAGLLKGETDG